MNRSYGYLSSPAILIVWLLTFSINCLGQVEKYLDKVVLNNGSVIWGIAEMTADEVLVHLDSHQTLSVPLAEVASLQTQKLNPRYYQKSEPGFYYQLVWGITLGKSHVDFPNETSFNISATAGYRFISYFGLGLGVGLYYYPQMRHLPIFLDVQGDLLKTRLTPIYSLRTGWSKAYPRDDLSDQVDETKGGYYLEPGLGLKWQAANHAWQVKVSYLQQHSETIFSPIDFGNGNRLINKETRKFERTTITLGITF